MNVRKEQNGATAHQCSTRAKLPSPSVLQGFLSLKQKTRKGKKNGSRLLSESLASAEGWTSPWDINVYSSGAIFLFYSIPSQVDVWIKTPSALFLEENSYSSLIQKESCSVTSALQVGAVGAVWGVWIVGSQWRILLGFMLLLVWLLCLVSRGTGPSCVMNTTPSSSCSFQFLPLLFLVFQHFYRYSLKIIRKIE